MHSCMFCAMFGCGCTCTLLGVLTPHSLRFCKSFLRKPSRKRYRWNTWSGCVGERGQKSMLEVAACAQRSKSGASAEEMLLGCGMPNAVYLARENENNYMKKRDEVTAFLAVMDSFQCKTCLKYLKHKNQFQVFYLTYLPRKKTAHTLQVVSVLLNNSPEHIEAHFGIPMAGAVLNPLNYRLDSRTLKHGSGKENKKSWGVEI